MGLKKERAAFIAGFKACYSMRQRKGLIYKRQLREALKSWEEERT